LAALVVQTQNTKDFLMHATEEQKAVASLPPVYSAFRDNVPAPVRETQARVFDHLGIPLEQQDMGDLPHGHWLDRLLADTADEVVVICDIDAFPLTRAAYDGAIAAARAGRIFGLAQVANHLDPDHIYASPVFMAFSRDTFEALGAPSLVADDTLDAAQILTHRAEAAGVAIDLVYPTTSVTSKWPLADVCIYGIGTFYGDKAFFHLFQSRYAQNVLLFQAVAEDLIAGRRWDFQKYLEITGVARDIPKSSRGKLRQVWRN
jgi:hypothetical protein